MTIKEYIEKRIARIKTDYTQEKYYLRDVKDGVVKIKEVNKEILKQINFYKKQLNYIKLILQK